MLPKGSKSKQINRSTHYGFRVTVYGIFILPSSEQSIPLIFQINRTHLFPFLFLNETKWSILYKVSQLIFVALVSCFLDRFHVANVREELLCQIDV